MATVNYLVRGNSNPTNITFRFRHSNKFDIYCTMDYAINPRYWSNSKKQVTSKGDVDLNNLQSNLDDLKNAIIKEFNNTEIHKINRNWILDQIKIFRGEKTRGQKRSDLVTDCIQYVIDTAPTKSLSERRVKSYTTLLNTITKYQNKEQLRIKDIDAQFVDDFKQHMIIDNDYSESYTNKLSGDLVTVCKGAASHGIAISNSLQSIKTKKFTNENVIYLNNAELETIEELELTTEGLINARKWLILGCHIGQRVSDLLKLTDENIKIRSSTKLIELKQQKTSKLITIPVVGKVEKILKDGFPYRVTDQTFNKHLKTICAKAKLNEMTTGRVSTGKGGKRKLGKYPKHKLVGSHICRRSFATNYYGKIPLHLLKQITGHSTEKSLINYVGLPAQDYAQQIAEYYTAIEKKELAKKENAPLIKIAN